MFVDDLLPNLESVHRDVPGVHTFQMVADRRLRPHAPCLPERHVRIDEWPHLHQEIEGVLLREGRRGGRRR